MSTVIRDAIIRLKLEQQKTRLEAPDSGPAKRAHEESAKAAKEVVKAQTEVAAATKETQRVTAVSTQSMLVNFREGGEGALRMARGLAFLSASGSEDLRKLAQTVAMAQGAFDLFAGAFKLFSNIGGPGGVAVVALGAMFVAVNRYTRGLEEAAAEVRKLAEEERKAGENRKRIAEEMTRIAAESRAGAADDALTPGERSKRLGIELTEINMRRQQAEVELRGLEGARKQFQADRDELRKRAEQFPETTIGALLQGVLLQGFTKPGAAGAAVGERKRLEQEATDAEQRNKDLRTNQQAILEQDIADQRRRRQIEQERYEEEFNRRFGAAQTQAALSSATLFGSAVAQLDTTTFRAAQAPAIQGIGELIRETQAAFDEIRNAIRDERQKLVQLRNELNAGHSD